MAVKWNPPDKPQQDFWLITFPNGTAALMTDAEMVEGRERWTLEGMPHKSRGSQAAELEREVERLGNELEAALTHRALLGARLSDYERLAAENMPGPVMGRLKCLLGQCPMRKVQNALRKHRP